MGWSAPKAHHRLLLALGAGLVAGTLAREAALTLNIDAVVAHFLEPIGQIFLRLMFMTVVPIVFAGLVLGVQQLSQHRGLGSTMFHTLSFTLILSLLSVAIGISVVNIVQPGVGLSLEPARGENQSLARIEANAAAALTFPQVVIDLVPKNPLQAATHALEGQMLSLMVFALIFGIALGKVVGRRERNPLVLALDTLYDTSLEIMAMVMRIAPIAVFALVFSTSYRFGPDLLRSLGLYVVTVVIGLGLQQIVVYPLFLRFVARRSPIGFFRDSYDVLIHAFATASSNATLPKALNAATDRLGLRPETSRFVLTLGSTANQNGTALFEGVTVLFLAQVYGIDLNFGQQFTVVIMSVLAGVGTAGVPGGSLPLIMILLHQVGIPPEGLGLILGVDRFLDMCRTTLNVSGDLTVAALVDRFTPATAGNPEQLKTPQI